MMTNKASPCLQCHAIGQFKPTGGEQVVNGPDLRQVAPRFRPGFLETGSPNPSRLVPYTAMPQNIAPHGPPQIPVPKTFENKPFDMVAGDPRYAAQLRRTWSSNWPAAGRATPAAPARQAAGRVRESRHDGAACAT